MLLGFIVYYLKKIYMDGRCLNDQKHTESRLEIAFFVDENWRNASITFHLLPAHGSMLCMHMHARPCKMWLVSLFVQQKYKGQSWFLIHFLKMYVHFKYSCETRFTNTVHMLKWEKLLYLPWVLPDTVSKHKHFSQAHSSQPAATVCHCLHTARRTA